MGKNYAEIEFKKGITVDVVTLDHKGGLQIIGTMSVHDQTKDPIIMHPTPISIKTETAIKRAKDNDDIAIVLTKIHPAHLNIRTANAIDFDSVNEIPPELCKWIIQLGAEGCKNYHIHMNKVFNFDQLEVSYRMHQNISESKDDGSDKVNTTATHINTLVEALSEAELSVEKLKHLYKIFVAANLVLGSTAILTKTPDTPDKLLQTVSERVEEFIKLFNAHKAENTKNLAPVCEPLDSLMDSADKVLKGEKIENIDPASYSKWKIKSGQKRG